MNSARDEDIFEIPPYPDEWTPEQRNGCYWHALFFTHMPGRTEDWYVVEKDRQREKARRDRQIEKAQEKQ